LRVSFDNLAGFADDPVGVDVFVFDVAFLVVFTEKYFGSLIISYTLK
jgi:hypothetical protein